MPDRKQEPELTRDSDIFLKGEDAAGAPSQGGREGGALARAIASEDEMKRAEEPDASVTRVRKSDEPTPGTGNLADQNR